MDYPVRISSDLILLMFVPSLPSSPSPSPSRPSPSRPPLPSRLPSPSPTPSRRLLQGVFEPFFAITPRGNCTFVEKASYAQASGAAALVVVNDGDETDENLPYMGVDGKYSTLSQNIAIPVILIEKTVGQKLLQSLQKYVLPISSPSPSPSYLSLLAPTCYAANEDASRQQRSTVGSNGSLYSCQ